MSRTPISLVKLEPPRASNSCGDCQACCDVLGVSELGKPYYARCAHLGKGCTIYETRPHTCRVYRCAWHMGFLGDKPDWRPDKFGLILQLTGNRIEIYEARPGSLREHERRLPHMITRFKSHSALRQTQWERPAVVVFPHGSNISIDYPVGTAFLPYASPEGEIPVHIGARPEVAEFSGEIRELLMPKKGEAGA